MVWQYIGQHYYKNEKLPLVFNNYFTTFSQIHDINTRYKNTNFIIPKVSSNLGSTSITFEGAVLWNNLDKKMKEFTTVKSFRKSLKDTFMPYPVTLVTT